MKFGVMLPQGGRIASARALIDVAQAAEALGFHAVAVRDHIVFNGAYLNVGMRGMDLPGDDRDMFEALMTLTYVTTSTTTIRLNTSVIILPNRHPLLLAKQLSTLDVLSGGRLTVGLGVGPNRRETITDTTKLGEHRTNLVREYDTFGATGPRGPRMDEYFEAIVALWTQERPSFHGKYVRFDDVDMFPKPIQRPHPPIFVGGHTEAALRRAARWNAGWLPSQPTAADIRAGSARLAALRAEAGHVPVPPAVGINVHVTIADSDQRAETMAIPTLGDHFVDRQDFLKRTITGDLDTFLRRIMEYRDAGADYVEVKVVCDSVDNLIDQLRTISEHAMPAVA
jgi:probable F420-dependent oxidoreductase